MIEVARRCRAREAAAARPRRSRTSSSTTACPATRIHVVPKVGPSESDLVRVLAVAPTRQAEGTAPPTAAARAAMPDTPVGESHFMADRPMNVRAGSSAMVAMVHGETTGGVVYLYDPISDRGDRALRLQSGAPR